MHCSTASIFNIIPAQCIFGWYAGTGTQRWILLTQSDLKEEGWFLHKARIMKMVNCILGLKRTNPVHLPKPTSGNDIIQAFQKNTQRKKIKSNLLETSRKW